MLTEPPSFLEAALDAAPAPTTQLMQPAARPARRGRVSAALPGERRKPGAVKVTVDLAIQNYGDLAREAPSQAGRLFWRRKLEQRATEIR